MNTHLHFIFTLIFNVNKPIWLRRQRKRASTRTEKCPVVGKQPEIADKAATNTDIQLAWNL